jgi:hypothetical protein
MAPQLCQNHPLRAGAGLVRARTSLINTARGLTKSYGERLRGCSPRKVNRELAEGLSLELQSALQLLLDEIESLRKVLDTADIVREAIFRQLRLLTSAERSFLAPSQAPWSHILKSRKPLSRIQEELCHIGPSLL